MKTVAQPPACWQVQCGRQARIGCSRTKLLALNWPRCELISGVGHDSAEMERSRLCAECGRDLRLQVQVRLQRSARVTAGAQRFTGGDPLSEHRAYAAAPQMCKHHIAARGRADQH